jgi:hypothetical protein
MEGMSLQNTIAESEGRAKKMQEDGVDQAARSAAAAKGLQYTF